MAGESRVEQFLREEVRALGGEAVKVGHGGWPDQLVLLPGGVVGMAELKDFGKTPRPLQAERLETLQRLGFRVAAPDSRNAVRAFLRSLC